SLGRPYLHYLLLPLPFALLGLVLTVHALQRAPRRSLAVEVGAALGLSLSAASLPAISAARHVVPTRHRELEIVGFIRQYAGSSPKLCILPNVPQYYVHLARRAADRDGYLFLPSDASVARALSRRIPAFLVDRGGADIPHYEGLFLTAGYRRVGDRPGVSAWLPYERDAT